MKRIPLPFIILLLISHWCSYVRAEANFDPVLLISNNPSNCNGSEGSISFSGLQPNTTYQVTYNDDGVAVGPVTITSTAAGQLTITGLNAGIYNNFIFDFNGTIKEVLTGVVLSNPIAVPLFTSFASICQGSTPPVLPASSNNGINGTWSSTVINNQASGTYTFTPAAGTCGIPVSLNITVIPKVTATFSFGTSLRICRNAPVPTLPNTSVNGINGTWTPAVIDPTQSGTYVFNATSPGCVEGTTFNVTVAPNVSPTFPFGTSTTICEGASVVTLPANSSNGITGTWSPAVVKNTNSGTYTFTPDNGQCATTTTYTVTVNPNITPVFNAIAPICSGTILSALPTVSNNGISGSWSPSLNNTATTTYTFTPTAGQCATATTLTITVNQKEMPTFTPVAPICSGATLAALPTTSNNGITGTWSPALNNTATTTYTFTPAARQCAAITTLTITVNQKVTPTFTPVAPICSGAALAALPTIADNGITGTWSPALNNTATTTYTFTPAAGQCATKTTLTITVNQKVTPSFPAVASICTGTALQALPLSSTNAIPVTGTWSPALNNTATTTYTFTPDSGQCANVAAVTIQVYPMPAFINIKRDTIVYDGTVLASYNFSVNDPTGTIKWNNSNPSIGLAVSGTGTIPSFRATNMADTALNAVITTVPFTNGCTGASQSFNIKVLPLTKDIFVPNVFSPDGDGKNDQLFIYGNYISFVEMQIYNQWGQHLTTITSTNKGWDGKYKASAQPVGVYLYVLKAELKDGRTVRRKGSITLIR